MLDKWPGGIDFTDGSGGKWSEFKRLRRCGGSVVQAEFRLGIPVFKWGAAFTMPGETQSAPRAELFAWVMVCQRVAQTWVQFISDSLIKVDLAHAVFKGDGADSLDGMANLDLWRALRFFTKTRCIDVSFKWVKGHASAEHFVKIPDLCVHDVAGNLLADEVAGKGASMNAADSGKIVGYLRAFSLTQKNQRRAVAVFRRFLPPLPGKRRVMRRALCQTSWLPTLTRGEG